MAKRGSGNPLLRLSIFLMVIGYGSVLLSYTEIQFTLLSWANSMQPWIGLIIGTAGLAVLVVPLLLARRGGSITPVQPVQQQNFGYGAPQQSYGPPQDFPQQLAPQQGFPQQPAQQPGFAPQQGFAQQGFAPQGFQPQQGFPQQGFEPQQGSPQHGFQPQHGLPPQSNPQQLPTQQLPPQQGFRAQP